MMQVSEVVLAGLSLGGGRGGGANSHGALGQGLAPPPPQEQGRCERKHLCNIPVVRTPLFPLCDTDSTTDPPLVFATDLLNMALSKTKDGCGTVVPGLGREVVIRFSFVPLAGKKVLTRLPSCIVSHQY